MRAAALLILAPLSACVGVDTPEACRLTLVTTLPLQMRGGVPVVEAQVNQHLARLVLDTGAEAVLIWESSLERLGLERDYSQASYAIGFGGMEANWATRPAPVALGKTEIAPAPIVVSAARWNPPGTEPVDGLIGGAALAPYDIDLDIPALRASLYERRRCPGGPPPIEGGDVLPVTSNGRYRLNVPMTVDGVPIAAELDSGSSDSVVDMASAGLTPAMLERDRRIRLKTADSAGMTARVHQFSELRVGSVTVDHPTLLVSNLHRAGYHGTLGSNFLRNHRVWISYGSQTVTMAPVQPRPR